MGLDPSDAPLSLRDTGLQEVYALGSEAPYSRSPCTPVVHILSVFPDQFRFPRPCMLPHFAQCVGRSVLSTWCFTGGRARR